MEPGRVSWRPRRVGFGVSKSLVAEPLAGGSARRGRWLASLVIGPPYAGWHIGLLHSGIARPDCRLRQLYLELATDAGWYGGHSGGLAQSSYRWLTTLQSTLARTPIRMGRRFGGGWDLPFSVRSGWGLTGSLVPCLRGRS